MKSLRFTFLICLMFGLKSSLLAYDKPAYGPGQVVIDHGQNEQDFADIAITDRTGESVKIDELVFTDEKGEKKKLSGFIREGRPAVFAMVYYECPSLCGLLMNGVVNSLRRMEWKIGDQFDVIFVSIDEEEGPDLAGWKKENYLEVYGRPGAAPNWHFLTGEEDQIRSLANQLGFGFKYVPETNEYAHSAGFFVLSPEGKISRTLYGVEFDPRDVKLALLEASQGKVGNLMDQVLLYCFRFDPNSKGYALHALNLVKAGGMLTLVVFGLYLFIFWRRQLKGASTKT